MYEFDSHAYQMPKQLRARKTLQDIAETTEQLIKSGDIESFTSEKLSALSGYSAGGIKHYLENRDDIFVHVFMTKRRQKFLELSEIINAHSPHADVNSLITAIVDNSIGDLGRFKLKVMQFMLHKYYRRARNPENFDLLSSMLIDSFMHAASQDQTNTFALMDKDELAINLKALNVAISGPFYQNSPIAGTEKHKAIAIRLGVKLFGESADDKYS